MRYWIRACDVKRYDVDRAYQENEVIDWTSTNKYEVGDIVYIYSSLPIGRVTHKCVVEVASLTSDETYDDRMYWLTQRDKVQALNKNRFVRLKLLSKVGGHITPNDLGMYNIQGPKTLNEKQVELLDYRCEN